MIMMTQCHNYVAIYQHAAIELEIIIHPVPLKCCRLKLIAYMWMIAWVYKL
jgi:hypothetical protein